MLALDSNESRSGRYASAPLMIARRQAARCVSMESTKASLQWGDGKICCIGGAGGCGMYNLPLMAAPLSVPQPSPLLPFVDPSDTPPSLPRSCTPRLHGSILPPILPKLLDKGLHRSTRRLRVCSPPIPVVLHPSSRLEKAAPLDKTAVCTAALSGSWLTVRDPLSSVTRDPLLSVTWVTDREEGGFIAF
jgi:hypothetical protein